jgi:hypothetical protein
MQKQAAALVAVLLSGCSAQARTYDEAIAAYSENRVTEAETALRGIAADKAATPRDRSRAYRELARIAWLIDGNAAAAQALLRSADATGEGACGNAQMLARVLQESRKDEELAVQADSLAGRCPAPEAAEVRLRAAAGALDLAATVPARRDAALSEARRMVAALTEDARGSLEGSSLRLELALLAGDAGMAVQAWKDYFWLSDGDVPQGMARAFPAAAPLFEAGAGKNATLEGRLQLIDLLVRAGFARIAERFAAANEVGVQAGTHPLWKKASAYFEARRELEATILRSNRAVARGGKVSDLEAALERMKARLLAAAAGGGGDAARLRQAYGLYGHFAKAEGYGSLHYGHIVQDERRVVEQYGHRANVAFVALDNMISNGFNGWLWDGTAEAGGWTEPDQTIVQVRTGWTSGPLAAWSLFSGGPERDRIVVRQAELAASDAARAKDGGIAYLPGLSDRLRLQIAAQVGERARALAAGGDLRRAFLQEYWRATFQASMMSHEGRHALDRTLVRGLARLSDANLEYRAKLSELALSDYPRLALGHIDDSEIGSGTGHAKANARLLKEFAEWAGAHSSEVKGFDSRLPPLVQIDRLTDDQIRAIARGLDPLSRND